MTLIMMYKKDDSSAPVIAGDRVVCLKLDLPTMLGNKMYYSFKYTRNFYFRKTSPKYNLKEGILIGGSGHKDFVEFVINRDGIQFPAPYLKNGSYNHYVSHSFVKKLLDVIGSSYRTKQIVERNMQASFLFSIETQVYWLTISYQKHGLGEEDFESVNGNLLHLDNICAAMEMRDPPYLVSIGHHIASNEAYKYATSLNIVQLRRMSAEQILTGAYETAIKSTRMCGLGLDIMHG